MGEEHSMAIRVPGHTLSPGPSSHVLIMSCLWIQIDRSKIVSLMHATLPHSRPNQALVLTLDEVMISFDH